MKAIQEGKFTQKELDDKVRRVLRLFYRTTMNPVSYTHLFVTTSYPEVIAHDFGIDIKSIILSPSPIWPVDRVISLSLIHI